MPARLQYCVTIIAVLKMQLSEAEEAFAMHVIVLDLKYSLAVTFLQITWCTNILWHLTKNAAWQV